MKDEEIEKIIDEEFGDILSISDEQIAKLSFAESCVYLETINKINERIEQLRNPLVKEGIE